MLTADAQIDEPNLNQLIVSQNTAATQYDQIITNQNSIIAELESLNRTMTIMSEAIVKLNTITTTTIASDSALSDDSLVMEFDKIEDEDGLKHFEDKISRNQVYRSSCIKKFTSIIGVGKPRNMARTIALQLGDLIFGQKFWSCTAWTGGRKSKKTPQNGREEGEIKFAFATHVVVISFFNKIVESICGCQLTQTEMADFIKVRTRNCTYVRSTTRLSSSLNDA